MLLGKMWRHGGNIRGIKVAKIFNRESCPIYTDACIKTRSDKWCNIAWSKKPAGASLSLSLWASKPTQWMTCTGSVKRPRIALFYDYERHILDPKLTEWLHNFTPSAKTLGSRLNSIDVMYYIWFNGSLVYKYIAGRPCFPRLCDVILRHRQRGQ